MTSDPRNHPSKEYTNGEVTVIWKPELCDHSALCIMGLPQVFDPGQRPWIDMHAASTEDIIRVVDTCPTKALTYRMNKAVEEKKTAPRVAEIKILNGGPYLISGDFVMQDAQGQVIHCEKNIALCRCGASKKKPFCDGAHNGLAF